MRKGPGSAYDQEDSSKCQFRSKFKVQHKYCNPMLRKAHDPNIGKAMFQEELEDSTEVIRIRKSKDRQQNSQKEFDKQRSSKHRKLNTSPAKKTGGTQMFRRDTRRVTAKRHQHHLGVNKSKSHRYYD